MKVFNQPLAASPIVDPAQRTYQAWAPFPHAPVAPGTAFVVTDRWGAQYRNQWATPPQAFAIGTTTTPIVLPFSYSGTVPPASVYLLGFNASSAALSVSGAWSVTIPDGSPTVIPLTDWGTVAIPAGGGVRAVVGAPFGGDGALTVTLTPQTAPTAASNGWIGFVFF